jgi:hypothetical protein
MKLLDYDRLAEFLARDFPGEAARAARMVGSGRRHESGYVDIVRFFGKGSVSPESVEVDYSPDNFQIFDPKIAAFAREIAEALRKEGRLYDGPLAMRMERVEIDSRLSRVRVQPLDYAEQAGSSFALDAEHPAFEKWGGTLRDYVRKEYREKGRRENPLAVGLGVCAMLMIEGAASPYLLIGKRGKHLASLEGSIGPSVAGSVDFRKGYKTLGELLRQSLAQEVEEEIGLRQDEYSIWPLALATEVMRGERPQLFGLVTTELPREEVLSRIAGLSGRPELEDVQLVKFEDVAGLNYEGWMSYWLAEEWEGEVR